MGWFKIDDSIAAPDQPLAAAIGYTLTRNVNAYPSALTRLNTFAYQTDDAGRAKVKWASYWYPRGTVVTVDVGIKATDFVFNVFYRTKLGSLGGKLYVRHVDSGVGVTVTASGTETPTSIEIPFTSTQPLTGLQGFFIGWTSDVSEESVGAVQMSGSVGNQVFCDPATGNPFPFTYPAGTYTEMYHLLRIDPAVTRPAPAANALLNYQICAFKHNSNVNQPPHGALLIWPELEIQPAILPTGTSVGGGSTKINADIYELGQIQLFSITVEVARAVELELLPPYNYQQTTAITALDNQINATMMQLQPNAGSLLNSGGFLGCVLPAGTAATFVFLVQNKSVVLTLNTSFQCITFNGDQSSSPDITFGVRDFTGATVGTDITYTQVSVPRYGAETTRYTTDTTMVAMNGILAGDGNWGMRDCITITEAQKSMPIRFTWGPNLPGEIELVTPYYGTITATTDLYIFGFNCQVL